MWLLVLRLASVTLHVPRMRVGLSIGSRAALPPHAPPHCYRDPEPFDWYQRYSGLKDLVGQYMKADDHILMIGCGNSRAFASRVFRACACDCCRRARERVRAWRAQATQCRACAT